MKNLVKNTYKFISDVFFDGSIIDKNISPTIPQVITEHYKIDYPKLLLDGVIIAASYEEIESLLERYKYHSDRAQAKIFVKMLMQCIPAIQKDTIITTVPMHWSRYTIRWFNHMDYLARGLSRESWIPYIPTLSTQYSRRQSKLSRKERLVNRKNQFTILHSMVLPEEVILIDDVISTGSTAHECAKILKENGVKRVIGIFLASSAYT